MKWPRRRRRYCRAPPSRTDEQVGTLSLAQLRVDDGHVVGGRDALAAVEGAGIDADDVAHVTNPPVAEGARTLAEQVVAIDGGEVDLAHVALQDEADESGRR